METIETPRLILRDFGLNDLNDFFEYCKVPGVGECAGWNHHKSISESLVILNKFIEDGNQYAIVFKGNHKVIGSVGINRTEICMDSKDVFSCELGYVLSKEYWGNGLMAEAVKEVIKYLFSNTFMEVIYICHYDFNLQSDRVIKKCGLNYYKTVKNTYVEALDKCYDDICYKITKEEYFAAQKKR
jgi:ribosomal-protein-alanine N-acetyltransferase